MKLPGKSSQPTDFNPSPAASAARMVSNNKGFSLTQTVVVLGMAAVLGLAVSSLMTNLMKGEASTRVKQTVSDIKLDIQRALQDSESFKRTVSNPANTTFGCLQAGKDCTATTGDFGIYEYNPTTDTAVLMPLANTNPTQGFNDKGIVCDTFDPVNGNDLCPFKYVATWTAYCPQNRNIKSQAAIETRCFAPLLDITVNLVVKAKTPNSFTNVTSLNSKLRLMKSQQDSMVTVNNLKTACDLIPGSVFDASSQVCNLPGAISCVGACPPGKQALIQGFYADGSPHCSCASAVAERNCNTPAAPFDKVLLGINEDGTLTCGDGFRARLILNGSIGNPPSPFSGSPY